jgi:DNA polymerase/3'-5' exonuclease PolX
MSGEIKYPYATAYKIALEVLEQLKPFCKRIEIAGSIRRKKAEVGDIELVIIPKPYSIGLFESGIATVINKLEKVKDELPCRYTQRIHPSGIKLDVFMAEEGNWGLVFALRTGSADYSHKVLANGWVRQGFKSEGGYLFRDGERYEVREEEDLFKLIGVRYVEPKDRNLQVN